MSVTVDPDPIGTAPAPKRRRLLAGVGATMIGLGGLAVASAIGLIAVFGSAGALDSGHHQVSTSSAALITDVASIQNTRGVGTITGWPKMQVTASGGDSAGVFIGVGPAADVQAYLARVTVDQITDFTVSPFEITVSRRPGQAHAAPPVDQGFWVASASSRGTADLNWTVQNGDYQLVIMNADGSPDLVAQARVQLVLPNAFRIALAILGCGIVVVAGGVALLVTALSRRRTV